MSLTIDVASLPSISPSFFNDESSNTSSIVSGKSIGRSEQYVSPDIQAFNAYMLSKPPEEIEPYDSASNDPLTNFSIRSNAVKTSTDAGVSMDTSSGSRPSSNVGCDQVDFTLTKGINISANLKSDIDISTDKKRIQVGNTSELDSTKESKVVRSKTKSNKSKKKYPVIEYCSDSDEYVLDDSDSDEGKCNNCKYKKKYFALRARMKKVALELIEDM
uniref:Non-structural protein 5 n=1 Tax=Rotavirus A TaxID=28875 RepID=A0A1B1LZ85_9REOV|nr:NSP5 [Rotavirus A]